MAAKPRRLVALASMVVTHSKRRRFGHWLREERPEAAAQSPPSVHRAAWWKVMCLTGVDYFSTLGYQPGIAFLAAGLLSPLATLILVLVTLFAALPTYQRIAEQSPHGQGSIAVLENLLPRWRGKALVLILLGFAATDFVITMTLSAADATAHIIENPFVPRAFDHPIAVTLVLLGALSAIFLKGFKEAVGLAVTIVAIYLAMNIVVLTWGMWTVIGQPALVFDWRAALAVEYASPTRMLLAAAIVFPKLALGLSGFETGVAVMPLVEGGSSDPTLAIQERIRNTKKLLRSAAIVMSVMLIASSIITTLLIPAAAHQPGGPANDRALAYLAHEHLGELFGTLYDLSTITILWFAGASAMAGLLNLVPRYLPRYGMAPEWAKSRRPLVIVIGAITFAITLIFDASVDAQAGAYATGVLVLMTSSAMAVMLIAERAGQVRARVVFGVITAVFVYTTAANIIERPEGHQDRVDVHPVDHPVVDALARAAGDGAARARRVARRESGGVRHGGRGPPCASHHRESAGYGSAGGIRQQAARSARLAPPQPGGAGAVRRGSARRCVRVQRQARGRRRGCRRSSRASGARDPRCPTRSPRCCCTCAIARASSRMRTSGGPRAIRSRTS